jgi:hypothetical protein
MSPQARDPPGADAGVASTVEAQDGPEVVHVLVHGTASLGRLPGCREKEAELDFGVDRALLLARPGDVVCLSRPAEPAYLEFLTELGLGPGPGRIVVAACAGELARALARDARALAALRDLLSGAEEIVLDPFVASPGERGLAATLAELLGRPVSVLGGPAALLAQANRKDVVRSRAEALGVAVAPGEIVGLSTPADLAPLREALARQLAPTGRALVRGARGAAGSSTFVVEREADSVETTLRRIVARTDNTVYLVEVMLDMAVSPNVLVHVEPGEGRVRCVGVTDQQLDGGLAHYGNAYPTLATKTEEMITSACRLARWLQSEGYRGLAGFDFVEYRDSRTGRREQILAELNARTNGAAYPKSVLDRLDDRRARQGRRAIGAFLAAGDLRTGLGDFAALRQRCGRLLFEPGSGRGVLPYNTASLGRGRMRAMALGGTRAEVEAMMVEFRRRIAA